MERASSQFDGEPRGPLADARQALYGESNRNRSFT